MKSRDNRIAEAFGVDLHGRLPIITDFDWSAYGVDRRYVITTTGRSGSTWLCHLIKDTGLAGSPQEFFNDTSAKSYMSSLGVDNFREFFNAIVSRFSSNRTFGFKIDPLRFFQLKEILDVVSLFDRNCTWIYLFRDDFVSQAFSYVKAKYLGRWHFYANEVAAGDQASAQNLPEVQVWLDREMWTNIELIIRSEQGIRNFFSENQICPINLTYENLVTDKRMILMNVLYSILKERSDIISGINSVDDKLVKLQIGDDGGQLYDFAIRNADLIEEIHRNRRVIDVAKLFQDSLGLR